MQTALFREALDICDRFQIRPYDLTTLADGVILVQPWDCHKPSPSLVGRTGTVSSLRPDGRAHLHVVEGCVRFLVVVYAPNAKPGDTLIVRASGYAAQVAA